MFLVFEGIDGSGHTTALLKVADFLKEEGKLLVVTKEPTEGNSYGLEIRELLKSGKTFDPLELQKLFLEDRKLHVPKIKEWLKGGSWVLSDRYFYSTIAFGAAEGIEWQTLIQMNKDFLRPQAAFILDVEAGEAMRRIALRGDPHMRFEKGEMLAAVRKNYLRLVGEKTFPEMILIDAMPSIEKVTESIFTHIRPLL